MAGWPAQREEVRRVVGWVVGPEAVGWVVGRQVAGWEVALVTGLVRLD